MKSFRLFPRRPPESVKNKVITNTMPLLAPLTGIGNYTLNLSKAFLALDQNSDYTFSYGFYYSKGLYSYNSNVFIRSLCKVKESLKKYHLFGVYGWKFKDLFPVLKRKEFDLYFEPRKNLKELLDAYLNLNVRKEYKLVVVGKNLQENTWTFLKRC